MSYPPEPQLDEVSLVHLHFKELAFERFRVDRMKVPGILGSTGKLLKRNARLRRKRAKYYKLIGKYPVRHMPMFYTHKISIPEACKVKYFDCTGVWMFVFPMHHTHYILQ